MRRLVPVAMIGLLLGALLGAMTTRVEAQLFGGSVPGITPAEGTAEFRGLWVDAYHDGAKTPEQIDRLLADARRANVNALLVQVRRRGDAYYNRSLEPRTEDPALVAGFDPLAYLIDRAHNGSPRLEVHAWIAAMPIWGDRDRAPRDPRHVFNQHGTSAPGWDNWLTRRDDGESWATGYFLDPGHPDAARYTADVALHIVREYDVDGLHLDYIRYPDGAAGRSWGYNETSVTRFNARHGREGQPASDDPLWSQWRRDQLTALVRRIYLGALALKPQVKISAAVIPWGDGPRTDADWARTSAYTKVFQDWRAWLEEGILDLAMPMNYFRESEPPQGAWFDRWVAWQRDHAYGRQIVPGVALYLNSPAESLGQVRRALAPSVNGSRVAGVALYSYAATRRDAGEGGPDPELWGGLAAASLFNEGSPPFATPAAVPPMAWKTTPQTGAILLRAPALDGATVEASGPTGFSGVADGGVYGIAAALPGRYTLSVRHPTLAEPRVAEIDVALGAVAEVELR